MLRAMQAKYASKVTLVVLEMNMDAGSNVDLIDKWILCDITIR